MIVMAITCLVCVGGGVVTVYFVILIPLRKACPNTLPYYQLQRLFGDVVYLFLLTVVTSLDCCTFGYLAGCQLFWISNAIQVTSEKLQWVVFHRGVYDAV